MGIQTFNNTIELSNLTPFGKESTANAGTGSFQPILSINSKGFMESFYGYPTGTAGTFLLRLTIDGVVKVLLSTATVSQVIGIVNKKDIVPTATAGTNSIRSVTGYGGAATNTVQQIKSYPITDSSSATVLLGDAKIYFMNSLLLEISCAVGTNYNYAYYGGYQ